jgi:hypothetical protein
MSRAFSPTDIIKQFQADQAKFQAANAAQFQSLISTIKDLGKQTGGTFDEALSKIAGLGTTARQRAEQQGTKDLAAGQQNLISSGLASSTLQQGLRQNVSQKVSERQGAIDESVGAQQAGLLTQRAGNETQIGSLLANAIGSQNIQGPDLGLFASLLQQAGAAGDPNQRITASVGPTTGQFAAPSGAFQRPDAEAQRQAAQKRIESGAASASIVRPGGAGGGGGGTGSGVQTLTNTSPSAGRASGGVFGQQGQAVSPLAQQSQAPKNDPCRGKGRFFPGIGCF